MMYSGTILTPRRPDEVFDLLANPERFAPLLPDYEGMSLEDPTHFTVRIVIAVAQIQGQAELAMELCEAVRPSRVEYRGQGIMAGSPLNLGLQFHIAPCGSMSEVNWQGEFSLDGQLAFIAGGLIEPMGRKHFDRMAQRLGANLGAEPATEIPQAPETGE